MIFLYDFTSRKMTSRKKKVETIRLDEHTIFYFGIKNGFKDSIFVEFDGIREFRKGRTKKENTKKKGKLQIYKKEDLLTYYSEDRGDFELDETKQFIMYKKKELIFIPLCNTNQNIVAYAIVSLCDYDKIKNLPFHRRLSGNQIYVESKNNTLHGIIFGRKAKSGGWEKVDNYVESEESLAAVWIQSETMPAPYMGKNWNYCRDKDGIVYIKMPGCIIDHRNSDGLDNRRTNLREAIFSLNGANRKKRNGCTSKYFGVHWMNNKWVSNIKFNGKYYQRRFDSEEDAATFHDIYSLVLYKQIICNNGMLSEMQIADILERGEKAIPPEYIATRKKERDLPKYIVRSKEKYKVQRTFMKKKYAMQFDTLEEAIASLPELQAAIETAKEEYRVFLEKFYSHNLHEDEDYGILEAKDKYGKVVGKAIVNAETWKKFIHINWTLSGNNRLKGVVNGIQNEVHVHSYREYNPDYHKSTHGTVDHKKWDKDNISDCRIENLRASSFSEQGQNREIQGKFPYRGIGISAGNFFAVLGWKRKLIYGKRRKYIEDAARDYNVMVLEKYPNATINDVPDTKTSAEFFYHKSRLSVEQIENFTTRELITCFYVNTDWTDKCGVTNTFSVPRSMLEKYRSMILKFFTEEFGTEEEKEKYKNINCVDEEIDDEEEENESSYLQDDYLKDEDEEENDEEDDENEEIEEDGKKVYKRKQYIEMPVDPETDASSVNRLCYGYRKGFDRSKILIDEYEAKMIRIIMREVDDGVSCSNIAKLLNSKNYTKKGKPWTTSTVGSVSREREKYEGDIIEGFECRYPEII